MEPSFAGGGPGAAHFARSGINNNNEAGRYRRSNTPMGRWPGEFYDNILLLYQKMDGKSLQNIWVSRECRPWATAADDDDNDNDNSPSPSPSALL